MNIDSFTANNAPGHSNIPVNQQGSLPKRFETLLQKLELVSNRTDTAKASVKEFISFSKNNLEDITLSLMTVSNTQEVVELIRQVTVPCNVIIDDLDCHDANTPYNIQDEDKLDTSLESLKGRLQQDIGAQTNEEKSYPLKIK
ncbi:hypothetical protein ABK905_20285 [Acerihabitans sp. KWT182]|uniref:Uncharacterized protein n=1 Tax=Acerihabitans sp. KWT182 TaxID=3157919 RepID=A0AAU7Q7G7_9GAMM